MTPEEYRAQLAERIKNPNVQKYLTLLQKSEGATYDTLFGGKSFSDFSKHPEVYKEFKQTDGKMNRTSAAGAYQFIKPTWNEVSKKAGLSDFSAANQDIGAMVLLDQNGSLKHIEAGEFDKAIAKDGKTWASLPSSNYAQPTRKKEFVEKILAGPPVKLGALESLIAPPVTDTGASGDSARLAGRPAPASGIQAISSDELQKLAGTNAADRGEAVRDWIGGIASTSTLKKAGNAVLDHGKESLKFAQGVGENVLNQATGYAAVPIASVAGYGAKALGKDGEAVNQSVKDALIYRPEANEYSKKIHEGFGQIGSVVQKVTEPIGDFVGGAVGDEYFGDRTEEMLGYLAPGVKGIGNAGVRRLASVKDRGLDWAAAHPEAVAKAAGGAAYSAVTGAGAGLGGPLGALVVQGTAGAATKFAHNKTKAFVEGHKTKPRDAVTAESPYVSISDIVSGATSNMDVPEENEISKVSTEELMRLAEPPVNDTGISGDSIRTSRPPVEAPAEYIAKARAPEVREEPVAVKEAPKDVAEVLFKEHAGMYEVYKRSGGTMTEEEFEESRRRGRALS